MKRRTSDQNAVRLDLDLRTERAQKLQNRPVCLITAHVQTGRKNTGLRQRARAEEKRRAGPVSFSTAAVRERTALVSGNKKVVSVFGKADSGF